MIKLHKFLLVMLCMVAACSPAAVTTPDAPTEGPTPTFPRSGVRLPENYRDEYVHYATIERADGTVRDIYVSPDTVASLVVGRALPNDTTIVIEAFYAQRDEDGALIVDEQDHFVRDVPFDMVHVLHKRDDWQSADFVSEARSGNWNFGSFNYATGDYFDEDTVACFHCHGPMGGSDFVYTYPQLANYLNSNEVQYVYCELTGRTPC